MAEEKRKILVIVEGAKTDDKLMRHLLSKYEIGAKYEIVPYRTNIYTLYREMFQENEPEDIDLLQLLKSRETSPEMKKIFDVPYSDILLIFDLDPQAPDFSVEWIRCMTDYFVESSDMGKLYLNYPMVEAFYHMKEIPDPEYDTRIASLDELKLGTYKQRVNSENRNHDYRKFAETRSECNIVICQNIYKAWMLVGHESNKLLPPEQSDILAAQLKLLEENDHIAVLSTCPFFIAEYNPELLLE